MLCDQIFRYFEPENTKVNLKIPNFLQDTDQGKPQELDKMTLICSSKDTVIESISANEFVLSNKTGKSG